MDVQGSGAAGVAKYLYDRERATRRKSAKRRSTMPLASTEGLF